jgi:PAS domain S-box-containing protein
LWLDADTRRAAWRALAEKGLWMGETVHARRDGDPLRVRLELSAARDARGRRTGVLLVARPAAPGEALPVPAPSERDPRDARSFLEGLLNAVADPIFVKDRDHRLLLVNDAYCALVGRRREEILGTTAGEHLPLEQAEIFHRRDDLVFRTGREDVNEEVMTDANGMTHALVTKKTLGRGAGGEPILVAVIRDVTTLAKAVDDLKRSQEQLRHAQKLEAVGRLAGGVAHDFNNVLTAIVGCAELMLDALPPGHPCRDEASEIRRAGEKAEILVRQLLAFSRREESVPRLLDLREVYGGMRKMLSRLLPADIELDFAVPDRLGAVSADPGLAEQILLNLAVNAGDAMPEGGRLSVSLRDAPEGGAGVAGPCVLLEVRDEGVGMAESVQRRIFEPFFTTKEDGTGLGLATVRDAAARSGGAVSVESAPGRGTTFRVFWPRAEGVPESRDASPARGAPAKAPRRARILVVEDDDAVRAFTVKSLERAGYEVLTAADGAEALRISDAHEGLFDAVVLDVVLPRVRGPEVAERLRARQPTARVLFMSGYRTEEASLPAGPDGQRRFLPKPFTAARLAEKIGELVA